MSHTIKENAEKIIFGMINEALGVPDNISETADQVYDKIFQKLLTLSKDDFNNDENSTKIIFSGQFRIADMKIKRFEIEFQIVPHENATSPQAVQMGARFESKFDEKLNKQVKISSDSTVRLSMVFVVPKKWEFEDFLTYYKQSENSLVSDMSHELKHAYDGFKNPIEKNTERAKYSTYSQINLGIPAIDRFIFYLYYIHNVENLVRPTEVVTAIKKNKIDQKDFINFLLSNQTYKTLKEIYNFNVDNFKEEIRKNIDKVDEILAHFNELDTYKTEDEKINRIIEILLINLNNFKFDALRRLMTTNLFEDIFGFSDEKALLFKKDVRKILKRVPTDEFLKYEEKNFKKVSFMMMKKISKLYDILSKDRIKTESIINWDLYHELNKTKEKHPIVNEIKYNKNLTSTKNNKNQDKVNKKIEKKK